jgi:hypothetical protein
MADLYVGATIAVHSRQLRVIDFGDEFTKAELGTKLTK